MLEQVSVSTWPSLHLSQFISSMSRNSNAGRLAHDVPFIDFMRHEQQASCPLTVWIQMRENTLFWSFCLFSLLYLIVLGLSWTSLQKIYLQKSFLKKATLDIIYPQPWKTWSLLSPWLCVKTDFTKRSTALDTLFALWSPSKWETGTFSVLNDWQTLKHQLHQTAFSLLKWQTQ